MREVEGVKELPDLGADHLALVVLNDSLWLSVSRGSSLGEVETGDEGVDMGLSGSLKILGLFFYLLLEFLRILILLSFRLEFVI
jgi:hypothetical protein